MPTSIDYLLVGHVAQDVLPDGTTRLGGTAAYAALTVRALGWTPGIVTACAAELDLSQLDHLACVRLPSPASTIFENVYTAQERIQTVRGRAAPLTLPAIPPAWIQSAEIIHLAPIIQEVAEDLVAHFAAGKKFVGLTPQGWMRHWDARGQVQLTDWNTATEVLARAQATVVSLEDLRGDWKTAQRWANVAPVLVVTEGAIGCTVFVDGVSRRLPASTETVVDPTGAGDIFAAIFFMHLQQHNDPWAAAQCANHLAAQSVTRPGLAGVPTAAEIAECRQAHDIYRGA